MATPAAAGAGDDGAQITERTAGQLRGVAQGREGDHRRAVLVVVEDRDVETLLELALDLEAPGRRDVLQVHPAEGRRKADDGLDDLVGVGRGERDRHRVDPAELLEEDRLALHHGEGGLRTDVPEAEHRGAVRDDGHDLRLPGVVVDEFGLLGDGAAHLGHAGRVREGQVVLVADRNGGLHGHLPAAVKGESRVEGLVRTAGSCRTGRAVRRAVDARIDDLRCHCVDPLSLHHLRVATPG